MRHASVARTLKDTTLTNHVVDNKITFAVSPLSPQSGVNNNLNREH